jgi:hypothetical protein
MASDIKLDNNNVILEGNLCIGTTNPFRPLHVEGSEIHSGGAVGGFSFDDRKKGNGERWVWYADNGSARLFSQKTGQDTLSILPTGNLGIGTNNPIRKLHVEGSEIHTGGAGSGFSFDDRTKGNAQRWLWYAQDGVAHLWSQERGDNVLSITSNGTLSNFTITDMTVSEMKGFNFGGGPLPVVFKSGISLSPKGIPDWNKFALTTKDDKLILNQDGGFNNGVRIDGNVQVAGALTHASSIALKENVSELSGQEAMAALQGLNAVKYSYKADSQQEQHLGFIAEEVPDLVANLERDRLSPMDLIAVLTKAVQEQQRMIADLIAKVSDLG